MPFKHICFSINLFLVLLLCGCAATYIDPSQSPYLELLESDVKNLKTNEKIVYKLTLDDAISAALNQNLDLRLAALERRMLEGSIGSDLRPV